MGPAVPLMPSSFWRWFSGVLAEPIGVRVASPALRVLGWPKVCLRECYVHVLNSCVRDSFPISP